MRAKHSSAVSALAAALTLLGAPSLRAAVPDEGARPVLTPLKVGPAYHLFGGTSLGDGIRFNNPYRLRDELGTGAESLSATAPYLGLKLGATIRGAGKLSQGLELDGSIALDGIPQETVTPSYLVLFHAAERWVVRGRAGLPVVIEPDANVGFEAALGGVFFATAAVGISADLIGSLFFGAATLDTARTAIPVLSMELGVLYDFEVLP